MLIINFLLLCQTSVPHLEIFGQSANSHFGNSVANAHDVNQDGTDDFIIGASSSTIGGMAGAGAAYLYSGVDGSLIRQWQGQAANYYLGSCVSGAGDLNGDNVPDLLIGATGTSPGGINSAGSVFAYSGADGSLIHQWDGTFADGYFGSYIAGGEDVNADGVPDVIVGDTHADFLGENQCGQAFVYSGLTGNVIYSWQGVDSSDYLGRNSTFVGDVNNDGFTDFAICAPGAANNYGQVTVYSGNGGGQLLQLIGPGYGDDFGWCVDGIGDINGDGHEDLVVGAPRETVNGVNWAGAAYAYSGADSSLLHKWVGTLPYSTFGKEVSAAGDFNQDGVPDILVGQGYHDSNGNGQSGAAFIYSGTSGSLIQQINGRSSLDYLGLAACSLGDFDADGYDDVVIANSGDDTNSLTDCGSVGIYSNRERLPLLEIKDLEAGQYADFVVTGCPQYAPVTIGYSLLGPGPITTVYGIADLTPPVQVLASLPASISGEAVFRQLIPGSASGITFYCQCKVANGLSTSVAARIN